MVYGGRGVVVYGWHGGVAYGRRGGRMRVGARLMAYRCRGGEFPSVLTCCVRVRVCLANGCRVGEVPSVFILLRTCS
jgi:hypothetical protein